MDNLQRKRLLRRTVLAARGSISENERAAAAASATTRLLALPETDDATTVMAFASFGAEIQTDALVERLLSEGRRVLVPLVEGTRLRAVEIASLEDLAPGFRGIREPRQPGPAVAPVADVIVVPGVAFDATGRRLGYGGGFYDAFLAEARGFRAGFCFDCQLVDAVPADPHDLPVDAVVTQSRTVRAT